MLLTNEVFKRVRELTGYENVQYTGVYPSGLILFKCWNGSQFNPDYASYVRFNQELTIVDVMDYWMCAPEGTVYFSHLEGMKKYVTR